MQCFCTHQNSFVPWQKSLMASWESFAAAVITLKALPWRLLKDDGVWNPNAVWSVRHDIVINEIIICWILLIIITLIEVDRCRLLLWISFCVMCVVYCCHHLQLWWLLLMHKTWERRGCAGIEISQRKKSWEVTREARGPLCIIRPKGFQSRHIHHKWKGDDRGLLSTPTMTSPNRKSITEISLGTDGWGPSSSSHNRWYNFIHHSSFALIANS